jgi:hypothetical protein
VGELAENADVLAASAKDLGKRIKKKIDRAIEITGFVVGLIFSEPPPKKPDDEDKPPPPAPTSTKTLLPGETEETP